MDNESMRDCENAKAHAELERFLAGFNGLPTEKLLAGVGCTAGGPGELDDDGPVWLRTGGQHEGDPVDHPAHYTSHPSKVECIQITEHMNFCIGNAVKYLFRAGKKDGHEKYIQDLRKAVWYINREIERFEKCKTINEWVQLCDK